METPQRIPITAWDDSDKPREKMLLKGKSALSDAELIAILMGSGNTKETAVDLAKRILSENQNNLLELSRKSIAELTRYNGIGEAKAISIIAALELGQRRRQSEVIERKKITSSHDVFEYMSLYLSDLNHEEFWILLLNRANQVIAQQMIGQGGISSTAVDLKKIFKQVLDYQASGIILAHNHPSGNLKPSDQDNLLTKKIAEAAKLMEISVLDHLIISANSYYSYADEGNL
jgi:DNA repair protein RadC